MYVKSLLDGMVKIPPPSPALRDALEEELARLGPEILHKRLHDLDPVYAARIHPRDRQRVLRALEVHATTGIPFSEWHVRTPPPLPDSVLRLGIGLPLAELTPYLALRVESMLQAGALDEARQAMERCPDGNAPGWSGIGCAELWRHLHGELDLESATRLWIANTRAYAKRQWTWFRADSRIRWFAPTPDRDVWLAELIREVRAWLLAEDGF